MRRSQYKKYQDQFQQEDNSISYAQEKSINFNRKHQVRQNNNHQQYKNQSKKNQKYIPPDAQKFLSIIKPLEKTQISNKFRIDYNSKNPPKREEIKVDTIKNVRQSKRRNYQRPIKSTQELDQQMQIYNSKGCKRQEKLSKDKEYLEQRTKNKDNRIEQKSNRSENNVNNQFIEEQLSFDIKPQKNFKKKKNDESFQNCQNRSYSSNYRQDSNSEIKNEIKTKQILDNILEDQLDLMNQGVVKNAQASQNESSQWIEQQILEGVFSKREQSVDESINQSDSILSSLEGQRIEQSSSSIIEKVQQKVSQQQNTLRIQKIIDKIKQYQDYEQKQISLQIVSIKNILEITIKQVRLIQLQLNIQLSQKQQYIIVKDSIIQVQMLLKYIQFNQIRTTNPKIYNSDPIVSQIKLCKIKVPPNQNKQNKKKQQTFLKKQKKIQQNSNKAQQLIEIIKLSLKCLSCQRSYIVPVLTNIHQANLSCSNCHQQMMSKIQNISLEV